jgi:hypothetical protein
VSWNGALVVARTKVSAGTVLRSIESQSQSTRARVRIMRNLRRYEFGVADEREDRAILRSLGVDGSTVAARFLVDSTLTSTVQGKAVVFAMSIVSLVALLTALVTNTEMRWVLASIAAIAFVTLAVSTAGGFATVGTDGVVFRRLWTQRFVPFAALARMQPTERGVTLVTDEGRSLDLDFSSGSRRGMRDRRDEFIMRVDEARAAATEGESRIDAARVSRGARSVAEWLEALRALARSEGGMRTAPIVRSQLFALVEDNVPVRPTT